MGMSAGQVRSGERRAYRVEYQAASGDGHVIVSTAASGTPSLLTHAVDLLQERGIDARIRRIVPVALPA
jgi:hypothetical protein